jgi:Fe-coproporphyrin III synthase
VNPIGLTYKRLYEGFNYRLRTFASERWADHCRPTSITLLLTDRWNAHCLHCDIWKNRGPEETPTSEQWRSVITDLRRWLGPVQVTFSGGEALMQRFAIDLIRHAVDVGLIVEVLSNGYWHNQEKIEKLATSSPWRITVSLDGIGATHNLIRGRSDFFERTQKSLETLERMRRERRMRFKIRLKTVVMRHNLDEVHEIARYAAARPGFEVFYQPIEQNYNTEEDPEWYQHSDNWPEDPVRAVAVVHQLIELKREGFPIANSFAQLEAMEPYFLNPDVLRLATQNHSAHELRRLCSALTTLELRADGRVFTCAHMESVGNIKDQPIRQIWQERPQWWRLGCCQQKPNVDHALSHE